MAQHLRKIVFFPYFCMIGPTAPLGIRACYFLQFGHLGETWPDIQQTISLEQFAPTGTGGPI